MRESRSRRFLTPRPVIPRVRRWWWLGVFVVLLAGFRGSAAPASPLHAVAVPDFFLSGPTPSVSGTPPVQVAADELTAMLPNAAPGPLEVIPRRVVREAQASMRWRGQDALSTSRLAELATALHADHLFVGRIDRFVVERPSRVGTSRWTVNTNLRLQVFQSAGRRFTSIGSGNGLGTGATQSSAIQQALRQALNAALPLALKTVARVPVPPSPLSSQAAGLLSPR